MKYRIPKKDLDPYWWSKWGQFVYVGGKPRWERLKRSLDKTIYATRCYTCRGTWKVYQQVYCACNRVENVVTYVKRDQHGKFV